MHVSIVNSDMGTPLHIRACVHLHLHAFGLLLIILESVVRATDGGAAWHLAGGQESVYPHSWQGRGNRESNAEPHPSPVHTNLLIGCCCSGTRTTSKETVFVM